MAEKRETFEIQGESSAGRPAARPRWLAEVRGIWRDRIQIADDFDELPKDIAAAFGVNEPGHERHLARSERGNDLE